MLLSSFVDLRSFLSSFNLFLLLLHLLSLLLSLLHLHLHLHLLLLLCFFAWECGCCFCYVCVWLFQSMFLSANLHLHLYSFTSTTFICNLHRKICLPIVSLRLFFCLFMDVVVLKGTYFQRLVELVLVWRSENVFGTVYCLM
jgi:hypothetical protein